MTVQLEFPAGRKPEADSEEVDRMLFLLEQLGDWAKADELLRLVGRPLTESNRRWVRAVAEASRGRIASAPSTPGYKLTVKVAPEELRLIGGLKSQGERMLRRYTEIMRVWHSNGGAQ